MEDRLQSDTGRLDVGLNDGERRQEKSPTKEEGAQIVVRLVQITAVHFPRQVGLFEDVDFASQIEEGENGAVGLESPFPDG